MSFETQFLQVSSSTFLYYGLEKTQIFVFFYTTVFTFVSLKYVQNKQAQLFDSQFHEKVSGAAFKKSKTNMMVQMLLFLFLRVLLIAWWRDCLHLLRYSVIKTSPEKEEAQQLVKIYKLVRPHSQRNVYCEMKEEIISQKKLFKVKIKKTWQGRTRDLYFILLYWFSTGFCCLSSFVYFFFPWLIINYKHKCIQAKTSKLISWLMYSLMSSLKFAF